MSADENRNEQVEEELNKAAEAATADDEVESEADEEQGASRTETEALEAKVKEYQEDRKSVV